MVVTRRGSWLDRAIAAVSPGWALERAAARARLARLYDAASLHHQHKRPRGGELSGDGVMDATRTNLTAWARYLDENSDIAISVLDTLVDRVLGSGLQYEPMVRTRGGSLHDPTNRRLRALWAAHWTNGRPDVTRELSGPELERIVCRTWLRDGELLVHHLEGRRPGLAHWTGIPYSVELLESDLLPWDFHESAAAARGAITHGVEKNGWGQPTAYHILREHPGSSLLNVSAAFDRDTRRVPATRISHLKFSRRIRQTRGVSVLHGVIHRIDDLRDMDESERIANRIAAAFSAVITKSADVEDVAVDDTVGDRTFAMRAGMVFDQLRPGEDVSIIGSDRPNPNLVAFRADQMRAIAGGTGSTYSSISKRYADGSYSAQRQELAESEPGYAKLQGYFAAHLARECWERSVRLAVAAGLLPVPAAVDPSTVTAVDVRPGGGIAWIDPLKEVQADRGLIDARIVSRSWVQRRRGVDPAQMDAQIEADMMTPAAAPAAAELEEEEGDSNAASDAAA